MRVPVFFRVETKWNDGSPRTDRWNAGLIAKINPGKGTPALTSGFKWIGHSQILYAMAKLIVVPTPIGNLEDITLRAIRVLKEADLILAEDTRVSSKLLRHYSIATPMISHHKFNEHKSLERVIEKINAGLQVAIISDAGTPGISDPGYLLIRACISNQIEVESLPGATALIPALLNSGLPGDRFHFEGFLPIKKGRQTRIQYLADKPETIVFYESPYRLVKTLEQLAASFGSERKASVSRELSKLYEETIRDSLQGLATHFSDKTIKGEFVLVVAGKE